MQCKVGKFFYINRVLSITTVRLTSQKCCNSKLEGNSNISTWFLLSSRSKISSALSELYGNYGLNYGSNQASIPSHKKIPFVKSFAFRDEADIIYLTFHQHLSLSAKKEIRSHSVSHESFVFSLSYFYYFCFKLR